MSKYMISPNYQNEIAELASVAYVTRSDGDRVAVTFMRQGAIPQEATHELVMLQLNTVSMSIDAARALQKTLGEIIESQPENEEPKQ